MTHKGRNRGIPVDKVWILYQDNNKTGIKNKEPQLKMRNVKHYMCYLFDERYFFIESPIVSMVFLNFAISGSSSVIRKP